jgi:hypothetical protein
MDTAKIEKILVSVGKKTPSGGRFLYTEDCEINASIFPHSSWQNGEFRLNGSDIPEPNYGEKWICNLFEKTNPQTGKVFYVACPVDFVSYDPYRKMQQDSLNICTTLLRIKTTLDKKGFEFDKENSREGEYSIFCNDNFLIAVTPFGTLSRQII